MSAYQRYVNAAVSDPDWQELRDSLKGLPTQEKIRRLQIYIAVAREYASDTELDASYCRVRNYLNALARGGFIHSIATKTREEMLFGIYVKR